MKLEVFNTPLNLQIVDFESVAKIVNEEYWKYLRKHGLDIEFAYSNPIDEKRVQVYFTYKVVGSMQKELGSKKDVILYVNEANTEYPWVFTNLKVVADYISVLYYSGQAPFKVLSENTGLSKEIVNTITEMRYRMVFEKFTPRRERELFEKFKIISP